MSEEMSRREAMTIAIGIGTVMATTGNLLSAKSPREESLDQCRWIDKGDGVHIFVVRSVSSLCNTSWEKGAFLQPSLPFHGLGVYDCWITGIQHRITAPNLENAKIQVEHLLVEEFERVRNRLRTFVFSIHRSREHA